MPRRFVKKDQEAHSTKALKEYKLIEGIKARYKAKVLEAALTLVALSTSGTDEKEVLMENGITTDIEDNNNKSELLGEYSSFTNACV